MKDYVSLKFLSDETIEYLENKSPQFEKINRKGCPTCDDHSCGRCAEQLQLYKHYLNAGIGLTYQKLDWGDFGGDQEALDIAKLYLTRHKVMVGNGFGITFQGKWGTGKTLITALMAKELVKLGYSVTFATFTQMVDEFTRGWGSNEEKARFESRVIKCDIFFLDDLGKEFRTKNNLSEATFDHVLRQRALDCRPTFMTTNMTLEDMKEGYGAAIFSLLKERTTFHNMDGDDWRDRARDRMFDEIENNIKREIY